MLNLVTVYQDFRMIPRIDLNLTSEPTVTIVILVTIVNLKVL